MKTKMYHQLLTVALAIAVFSSCKKEESSTVTDAPSALTVGAIAIGTSASLTAFATSGSAKDSLYIIKCHTKRGKKDSVAFSGLPAVMGSYLTANYPGYIASKAYKITESAGVVANYIAVIKVNGNLVGLKFTAAGVFLNVLEQRAGSDLGGKGWHDGGPFCNRDGIRRDTIAITALPVTVKTYFTANYPADTLLHAYTTRDTTYVLVSKNKGLYATGVTAAGKLVKRMQVSGHSGKHIAITAAGLPAVVSSYLSATYPAYVFNKAFSENVNNIVQEYHVFITSNSTNYVVKFTASGVFVKAMVVR